MSVHTYQNVVDIHDLVVQICERLDLDPNFVSRLEIEPLNLVATVLRRNDEGTKYILKGRPGQRATAAVDILEFNVTA